MLTTCATRRRCPRQSHDCQTRSADSVHMLAIEHAEQFTQGVLSFVDSLDASLTEPDATPTDPD